MITHKTLDHLSYKNISSEQFIKVMSKLSDFVMWLKVCGNNIYNYNV